MNYIQRTIQAYEDTFAQYALKKDKTGPSIKFLKKFTGLLKGKDILEIGFGVGNDTDWFIQNEYNYTGIEPVKKFHDHLKVKFPKAGLINQDILKADFKPESFDGIWAMAVLLHLKDDDIKSVLEKCYTWLKPDGVIFVTLKEGEGELTRDDGRLFNLFTKEKFLALIKGKFDLLSFVKDDPEPYNIGRENWLSFYLRKS